MFAGRRGARRVATDRETARNPAGGEAVGDAVDQLATMLRLNITVFQCIFRWRTLRATGLTREIPRDSFVERCKFSKGGPTFSV